MRKSKQVRLEAAGWRCGDAGELLGLTPEEKALVELQLAESKPRARPRTGKGERARSR